MAGSSNGRFGRDSSCSAGSGRPGSYGDSVSENLQREDLNPIEEAEAYDVLMREFNLTQEEVAQAVGKGRPTIANRLRLLRLPDVVKTWVAEGRLSAGHAKVLVVLDGKLGRGNWPVGV